MPASARKNVDLPAPEGPVTSTSSCGLSVTEVSASNGFPCGSLICTYSSAIADCGSSTRTPSTCFASSRTLSSDDVKPIRRFTVARQVAYCVYALMNQESEPYTLPNAEAVWKMPPGCTAPE